MVGLALVRRIQARAATGTLKSVRIGLHPELADALQNGRRRELADLEEEFDIKIEIVAARHLRRLEQKVEWFDREPGDERPVRPSKPARVVEPQPEPLELEAGDEAEDDEEPAELEAEAEGEAAGEGEESAGNGRKRSRRRRGGRRRRGRGANGEAVAQGAVQPSAAPTEITARVPAANGSEPEAGAAEAGAGKKRRRRRGGRRRSGRGAGTDAAATATVGAEDAPSLGVHEADERGGEIVRSAPEPAPVDSH